MKKVTTGKNLKWLATAVLIIGTFINAGFPELYPVGPLLLALGGIIWLIVSFLWKEPALIVTNLVLTAMGFGGILLYYIK
jgi:hypothetical protein|tara:strand:+ start:2839 stop:3078 length:240 start_codon:yes stop_codon:yes gene_type:complete